MKNLNSKHITIIASSILGAIGVFVFISLLKNNTIINSIALTNTSDKINLTIFSLVMLFIVITVHELGHLITGIIYGLEFNLFVIGCIGFKKNKQGSIIPFFNTSIELMGGVTVMSPKDIKPFTNLILAYYYIAGPIISFLFSLICFIITQYSSPQTAFVFNLGAIASFLITVATYIPSKTGIFYTDRKKFQRLIGNEKDIEIILIEIQLHTKRGYPINQFNEQKIIKLTTDESPLIRHNGLIYLYHYYLTQDPDKLKSLESKINKNAKFLPKSIASAFEEEISTIV